MSNKICDLHVHSKYSCDSNVELEDYCLEAIKKDINVVCFTEHIDFNVKDPGYGYYKKNEFFDAFNHLKEKYKSKIQLLCGLEFSEPHLYKKELKEYSLLPYDYIIGSVHYWYKDISPSQLVIDEIPVEVCYEYYWDEVLKAVKSGGFDCLGHLDFPKRYYNKLILDEKKINEICKELVRNNIYLEINTSSIRKSNLGTMPGKNILSIYKSCGGKYVTIGSDSHFSKDIGADIASAKELVKFFGFEEVVFIKRIPFLV